MTNLEALARKVVNEAMAATVPTSPAPAPAVWTVTIPKPSMGGGFLSGLEARGMWFGLGFIACLFYTGHLGPLPLPTPKPPAPVPTPTPTPTPPPLPKPDWIPPGPTPTPPPFNPPQASPQAPQAMTRPTLYRG